MPTKRKQEPRFSNHVTVRALMARINRKFEPVEVNGELVPMVARIYTRTSVATGKRRDTLIRRASFSIRLDKNNPEPWNATAEPGVATGATVRDFEKYARDLGVLRHYEVLRPGRHDA